MTNKTLDWIRSAELPGGGLSAWQYPDGKWHSAYIECSAYSLPTLVKWGEESLADRCANWLLSVQNPDGSFNGLDGVPRPFDTSAVIEGLNVMYEHTADARYYHAAYDAIEWSMTQITHDGYLRNNPRNDSANIYNLRASYIIGNRKEFDFWKPRGLFGQVHERSHYLAYALEGALNFGEFDFAMPYIHLAYESGSLLMPFYVTRDWKAVTQDFDLCASAQMAILFHRVGLDASKHYEAILRHVTDGGGVPQSTQDDRRILWGARFFLELQYLMEGVKA